MKRSLLILLTMAAMVWALCGCTSNREELEAAQEAYLLEADRVDAELQEFKSLIAESEQALDTDLIPEKVYTRTDLEEKLEHAKKTVREIPQMPETIDEIRSSTAGLKNITYTKRIEELSLALHSYQDSLAVTEALVKKISEESARTKGTERLENEDGEYTCILTDNEEGDLLYNSSCYAIEIRDNDLFVSGSLDYYLEVGNHEADPIRLPNAIHRFRLDSSTRFVERGGDLGDRPYPSRNVLIEKAQEMINGEGGLGLVIAVQNGTVASVALSS